MTSKTTWVAAWLVFFMSAGCTTVHFRSKGQIPVYVTPTDSHVVKKAVEDQIEFFLWGFIPQTQFVVVDEMIMNQGFISASDVSVTEYQTWGDLFFSLVSLGIYIPKHVKIEFYGLHGEYDD